MVTKSELISASGEWRVVVRGHRFEFHGQNGAVWMEGTFFLNQATTPKQIDFQIEDGSHKESKGKTALGIYQVVGTTLSVVSSDPGVSSRPSSFEKPGEEGVHSFIANKR